MSSIQNDFKIASAEDIVAFFPRHQNSLTDQVATTFRRVNHYVRTGVWIDAETVCGWLAHHKEYSPTVSRLLASRVSQRKIDRAKAGLFMKSPTLCDRLKDAGSFIVAFIKSPNTVGSVMPSSPALAKAIIRQIPKGDFSDSSKGRMILEVGPGTGAFTDRIIRKLGKNDTLHLVEYDADFCEILRQKYRHLPNVVVINASITEYTPKPAVKYDYIISGLPLNAFEVGFVQEVFRKYTSLIKQGGKMSYFEYLLLPKITQWIGPSEKSRNLQQVLEAKEEHHRQNRLGTVAVWLNVTPAQIREHIYNHV